MYKENFEKIFNDEVREKKAIGKNIFHRKSTRKKGDVLVSMPSDYLSKKELLNLNGKVEVSSMWDKISYQEFMTLGPKERLNCIAYLKQKHGSLAAVERNWNLSVNVLSGIRQRAERQLKEQNQENHANKSVVANPNVEKVAAIERFYEAKREERNDYKFSAKLDGTFASQELQDRLAALGIILIKDKKYKLMAKIEEL